MKTLINFENIYVSYDVEPILKNINLTIKEGENWVVLGANGSGKSTLIKLLSNDIYPNTKYPFKKEIFGKTKHSIFELKNDLGIITNDLHNYFENHGNFLTVYEVVLSGYFSSIGVFKHQDFSQEQHQRAKEVINFLEISHLIDKKVHELSTGELRKSVIGRALVHKPKAFVLDEPTTGLDIKAQRNFLNLIKKLSSVSSIILITHHIEEIIPEISHIALIYNQTIYKQGKKADILNSKNLSEIFEMDIKLKLEDSKYYLL